MPEQLELPEFAYLAKPLAVAKAGTRRQRKAITAIPDNHFPQRANRAITAEGVTWTQYAMMCAISGEENPPTIAGVGLSVGMSYHAIRNQATRTNWFKLVERVDDTFTRLCLSPEGVAKFARITARLASHG
jgi:hypothetical protein